MSEQRYEYRVITGDGEEFDRYDSDSAEEHAEFHCERQEDRYPEAGPHRVQRRTVGEWEIP